MSDFTEESFRWLCPYCPGFYADSVYDVRAHIDDHDDETHTDPEHLTTRPIPGYGPDGELATAICTAIGESFSITSLPQDEIQDTGWYSTIDQEVASRKLRSALPISDDDASPATIDVPAEEFSHVLSFLEHLQESGRHQQQLGEPDSLLAACGRQRTSLATEIREMLKSSVVSTD